MTKRRPTSEQEWLTADSPYLMIQHLHQHGRISRVPGGQRQLRLFRCACCRAIWDIFDDEICRQAVDVSERFADKAASRVELARVQEQARDLAQAARQQMGEVARRSSATDPAWKKAFQWQEITAAAEWTASTQFNPRVTHIVSMSTELALAGLAGNSPASPEAAIVRQEQDRLHSQFLRDIFGNPFRPLTLTPSWLTATVQALAAAAYEERPLPNGQLDPARLAILADALEDSGCTDPDILGHLRGPGPHVRGCHVLDLLLGGK